MFNYIVHDKFIVLFISTGQPRNASWSRYSNSVPSEQVPRSTELSKWRLSRMSQDIWHGSLVQSIGSVIANTIYKDICVCIYYRQDDIYNLVLIFTVQNEDITAVVWSHLLKDRFEHFSLKASQFIFIQTDEWSLSIISCLYLFNHWLKL